MASSFAVGYNTTAPLDWYWAQTSISTTSNCISFNTVTTSVIKVNFKKLISKWKRWFDVFRVDAESKLPKPTIGVISTPYRLQEKFPGLQRLRQKRRMFVQSLYAT
jgi:hypothetical protein